MLPALSLINPQHALLPLTGKSLPSLAELEAGIVWPQGREDRFWERPPRKAPLSLPGPPGKEGPPATAAEPLTIIHIAAEMAPIAKVGGGAATAIAESVTQGIIQ